MISSRDKKRQPSDERPLLKSESLGLSTVQNSHTLIAKSIEKLTAYAFATVPADSRAVWMRNMLISSLLEAGIVLGATYGSYHFMEDLDDEGKNPFIIASLGLFLNFMLRTPNIAMMKPLSDAIRIARSFLFTQLDSMTRYTLFHEGGHALMIETLFKEANPKITINPTYFGTGGGKTSFDTTSELTSLGEKFGRDASRALVTASGVGESMLECYAGLIAAQLIPDNFSEVKTHLRLSVLMHLERNIFYALSSYGECKPGHDFCNLEKRADISPYVAILFMVGTVLLLQIGLSITTRVVGCGKKKMYAPSATEDRDEENRLDLETPINGNLVSIEDDENQISLDNEIDELPRRSFVT